MSKPEDLAMKSPLVASMATSFIGALMALVAYKLVMR